MSTLYQGTRDYRRFMRRMAASTIAHQRRGDDTGIYDVLKGPVPTPKLEATLRRFIDDQQKGK